jgi:hypothetical protein
MTEQREGAVGVRDLLLVVPSRERPANIARLAEALHGVAQLLDHDPG